jgi:hypothetical protein
MLGGPAITPHDEDSPLVPALLAGVAGGASG